MLAQTDIALYLLQEGLVAPQSVVDSDLMVADATSRNSNYMVISERGPSYMLKQGVGPERSATLAHEAAVYELLQPVGGKEGPGRYLPRVHLYNAEECILVLELAHGGQNLYDYHSRRGRFSARLAEGVGDALGALHKGVDGVALRESRPDFPQYIPWPLVLHRPDLSMIHGTSSAGLQLIKIIQQFPEFCAMLDAVRHDWQPSALIHYDMKWTNIVVSGGGADAKNGLKLVDWELACIGDPCWDVGSIFSNYLDFWLRSIPITGEAPPDRFVELARYPLAKMQPAMRRFWAAYVERMELDPGEASQWLVRSVRYSAARLIQTAFEQTQNSMQLTGDIITALQLSMNILQRPQEAAIHLLGIPVRTMEADLDVGSL